MVCISLDSVDSVDSVNIVDLLEVEEDYDEKGMRVEFGTHLAAAYINNLAL